MESFRQNRIHDLRHAFASNSVALGQDLPIIGRVLGHTQPLTTVCYSQLAARPTLEVADNISENFAGLIERTSLGLLAFPPDCLQTRSTRAMIDGTKIQ